MRTCEDCGSKIYGGYCTWCDESHFIAEQYIDLVEYVPQIIQEEAKEADKRAKRRQEEAEYKSYENEE